MKKILTLSFLLLSLNSFGQKKVAPADAANFMGDSVTLCEKVYGSRYLERTSLTILYLGNEFPNQLLMVVISGADRDKFKFKPEVFFKGKRICVTGQVSEYGRRRRSVESGPAQIS